MTEDGQFIHCTGPCSGNRNLVAKLSISDLAGDPVWQTDLGTNNCVYPTPGENNNIYVSSYGVGRETWKLSAVDGSTMWGGSGHVPGGYYHAYCFETNRLFFSMYGTATPKYMYQKSPSDGSVIGYSTSLPHRTICCNIFDQDILYAGAIAGGGSPENMNLFDISSDWPTGQAPDDTYNEAYGYHHYIIGDPTGYMNYRIRLNNPPPVSTGIPRNLMMIINR